MRIAGGPVGFLTGPPRLYPFEHNHAVLWDLNSAEAIPAATLAGRLAALGTAANPRSIEVP